MTGARYRDGLSSASPMEPQASPPKASIPSACDLRCDICGDPAIGVASSSVGAMSQAYCASCAGSNVLSLFEASYLYDFVSTDGEGLADWVQTARVRNDDQWLSWPEYVAERKQGPFCPVHQVHALPRGCSLCDYESDCASAIEARSDETGTGSTEGESAPEGDAK